MIKVVVFGSRDFNNYELLKSWLDFYLQNVKDEIVIVSGTARGADTLGELYAKEHGYQVERYPANWKEYGNRAGMIRNRIMADVADYAVGFWDGKSRGTKGMIDICRDLNVPIRVVNINA